MVVYDYNCTDPHISDTRYQIIVCIFITMKYQSYTMSVCQDPVSVPESVCAVDGPGSNYSASCNSDNYDSVQSKLETTITMYYYLLSMYKIGHFLCTISR